MHRVFRNSLLPRLFFFMLFAGCAALQAIAASGDAVWTNRFDGGYGGTDEPMAIASDANGNVFVTGYALQTSSTPDIGTVGYSPTGLPLWINYYNGPANSFDYGTAIATDVNGNVVVGGRSANANDFDFVVIKYSPSGAVLWSSRYQGIANGADMVRAVAVDASGNVIATGASRGSGTDLDFATIKYSPDGVPIWTNRYDMIGSGDDPAAIAVDNSGNVYVTGSGTSGNYPDFVTIAYSAAGVPLWTNTYNGPFNRADQPRAIALDGNGNVFVTGESHGSGLNFATIAYSAAGLPLWTNRYVGPGLADYPRSIAADSNGNIYVTGESQSEGASTGYDFATIKYSNAGVPLWTNRYDGVGQYHDFSRAVRVDTNGNVIIAGYSADASLNNDYTTIAYSGAGVPMWTNFYNSPGSGHDFLNAMTLDQNGDVLVTGRSASSESGYDYATIKYQGITVTVNVAPTNITLSSTTVLENQPIGTTIGNFNAQDPNAGDSFTFALVAESGAGDNAKFAISGNTLQTANVFSYETRDSYTIRVRATDNGGLSTEKIFIIGITPLPAGSNVWTRILNGVNDDDAPSAMALDSNGNVFITGSSRSSGYFTEDFLTVGYSGAGLPMWTNRFNGSGDGADVARAIAVDGEENVVVTGESWNGVQYDYTTIKFSWAGAPLWTNRYRFGGDNSYSTGVVVDQNGTVFVTGYSLNDSLEIDYATLAYSASGVSLWTNRYTGEGAGYNSACAIALDASGDIVVTGTSTSAAGNDDYATIKYSNTGVGLWTNRFNGRVNSLDTAKALAIDKSGNVFVTGNSRGPDNSLDLATVAYSSSGAPLWTNYYNGPAGGNETAAAIVVDQNGKVFVTASSPNAGGYSDYVTISYSGSGVALWTNVYNGPSSFHDNPTAITVDGAGNVFVTGGSHGSNFALAPDYLTIAYSNSGVPLWTNRLDGTGQSGDTPSAIAADQSGNLFVTGRSKGANDDYMTVNYATMNPLPFSGALLRQIAATPDGHIQFKFGAKANLPFVVETRVSLTTGDWMTLTNIPPQAVGTTITISDPNTGSARFYRVLVP